MLEIRPASPADSPAIATLVQQYWSFEGIASFDAESITEQLSRLLATPHLGRAWLAVVDGEPAGYLIAVYVFSLEHQGLTVEIDEFFVAPRHQDNGIGRQLLAVAESELAAAGCTNLSLQLARGNDRARRFYRRHGFAERDGYELLDKALASPNR